MRAQIDCALRSARTGLKTLVNQAGATFSPNGIVLKAYVTWSKINARYGCASSWTGMDR